MKIKNLYSHSRTFFKSPYFGFTQGHRHKSDRDLKQIQCVVGREDSTLNDDFESNFSKLIGEGQSVCFSAGRMGFYALMEVLEIGEGDEVILLGATCSVMANAILRRKAVPIYADIDPETYGSCARAIESVITRRTRLIVAQHSFGIPCKIDPIVQLAKAKNIFLLEDCALTLATKIKGVTCGNFGQAALFSTDNTKPLNTLVGGFIYTKDRDLYSRLKSIQAEASQIPREKQFLLWKQLLFERKYCWPDTYGKMKFISSIRSKLGISGRPFLDEDYEAASSTSYPYPAKMPSFLALLGIQELNNWSLTVSTRKAFLRKLLGHFSIESGKAWVPNVYQDASSDIVPLRFACHEKNGKRLRTLFRRLIDVDLVWFKSPIEGTQKPLEDLFYKAGSCPVSERVGPNMINIPCCIDEEWQAKFFLELDNLMIG